MGWQARARKEKELEKERILSKEEIAQIKKEKKIKRKLVKKEIDKPIKSIEDRVSKSNMNLLFLIFRPALFAIIGVSIMLIKNSFEFSANEKLWPLVFTIVNILTTLLMIPIFYVQRINFKNLLKYKEKNFKVWEYILITLGFIILFAIGLVVAEFVAYGSFLKTMKIMLQSQNTIISYALILLLPLTAIIAEDLFLFGYIGNAAENTNRNVFLIILGILLQYALFPFSFDLLFAGYRMLSLIFLISAYVVFYKKTKNLLPIVISHSIINLITMIAIAIM